MICEQASSVLRLNALSQDPWTQRDRENQWRGDGALDGTDQRGSSHLPLGFLTAVSDEDDD